MDPINRLNSLMEALRRRVAEPAKRSEAPRLADRPADVASPAVAERPSLESLRQSIQERIRGIEADGPERQRRAQRVFLESVIAWEFGDQLLLDSQLDRLIDRIQENFEADPDLDRQFHELLTQLSQG